MYQYLDFHLLNLAGTPITIGTLITFGLIITATLVISRLLEGAIERALRLRKVTEEGSIGVARRLVHYLVLLLGFGVGLQTIGINLSALFAAGAVFAVAIGFAMQNITQNFVSGVILLAERTIKPGDILVVEGQMVKVSSMGIRATVARTLDEEEIIIPNSILVQSTVKNLTLKDQLYRLRTVVGVVYAADMSKVRQVLEEASAQIPWRISSMSPRIHLKQFGSSSVDFEVSVWIDDPWKVRQYQSQLNEKVWWALKASGIVIAFPQLDIHLDSAIENSLTRLVER